MPFFTATLYEKTSVASGTFELTFKITDGEFAFIPGQYVWVILSKLDAEDPKGARRAFSITSSSLSKDKISILFRSSQSGFKQTLINLPVGAEVKISGPRGSSYVVDQSIDSEVIMIAGGVGVAPYLGILRSLPVYSELPKLTVVFLNATQQTQFLVGELEQICNKNSISFINKIGKFESDYLPSLVLPKATYFICGPQGMVNDVYEKLVKAGARNESMRFEQFYPVKK